jgi:hypothetical protein
MKHPQLNASNKSRNAGIAVVGFFVAMFFNQWVGAYSIVASVLFGFASYANDVYYKNDPSKLDPAISTAGGILFLCFETLRHT